MFPLHLLFFLQSFFHIAFYQAITRLQTGRHHQSKFTQPCFWLAEDIIFSFHFDCARDAMKDTCTMVHCKITTEIALIASLRASTDLLSIRLFTNLEACVQWILAYSQKLFKIFPSSSFFQEPWREEQQKQRREKIRRIFSKCWRLRDEGRRHRHRRREDEASSHPPGVGGG